jgi:hypothetical protein
MQVTPMPTSPDAIPARDPLAYVRWMDVILVVLTAPVVMLAGAPALGISAGAVLWVVQRAGGYLIEQRARAATDAKTFTGLMLASTLGRAWVVGLTILAVGLAGEREDGLAAAILVISAFTLYFALALILRPSNRSNTPS